MTDKRSKRLSASSSEHDDDARGGTNYADWVCSDSECGNVNFAKRTCCNRCGKDRGECPKKKKLGTEIGKAAAEKSKGLFSADDWQCNKCGNVNWARRQQCNMCNAPKFGDVEERTGYGGGYNDRGVVEYKERRNDDDDEYDEFGRRRKKRKVDNRSDEESKDSSRHSSPPRSRSKSSHSRRSYHDKDDEKDEISSEDEKRHKRLKTAPMEMLVLHKNVNLGKLSQILFLHSHM
ncbi:hypothetical protein QAD02_018688 [Eretmocerus hayati]|uniref:Uncharacterized protein n=1 Tax=Eretmocerus hayati TaxID=131215 RepID=A0ACC2PHH2_9HYME|nr:hypothetical protein QAD02_018688 [Eretmocerus hayati]